MSEDLSKSIKSAGKLIKETMISLGKQQKEFQDVAACLTEIIQGIHERLERIETWILKKEKNPEVTL